MDEQIADAGNVGGIDRADRDYRGSRWHARNPGVSGLEALRPIRTNACRVRDPYLLRSITPATLSVHLIQSEFRVHCDRRCGFDYSIIDCYSFEMVVGIVRFEIVASV